jgi:site-specific DNA-methyltransferase (cytosine-N4-specific)
MRNTLIQSTLFEGEDKKHTPLENDFKKILKLIPANKTNSYTHNIHSYPATFIPQYPRLFIKHFTTEESKILDPMCGAGTTLIEACLEKKYSTGLDIDPIAFLISKVSTTPIGNKQLNIFQNSFINELISTKTNDILANIVLPDEKDYPNFKLWFRDETLKELLFIKQKIFEIDDENLKNLAKIALSYVVKPVSNADPRDIFPERDKNFLVREKKEVFKEYSLVLNNMVKKVKEFSKKVNNKEFAEVFNKDARLPNQLVNEYYDLVCTSPPYAYAIDYARVHQLSTLLFIMNNEELRMHRKKYIGRDRISTSEKLDDFSGFQSTENELSKLYEVNKKYALVTYNYFKDMKAVTQNLYTYLKDGGKLVYIVGNSNIKNTTIKVHDVYKEICKYIGFRYIKQMERPYYMYRLARKRNVQSDIIESDIFLIFEK